MTKPDLKGKTIEINGKRYLVASCTFRQSSARDAAGWAMLLVNERGELDQHMVGIDGPIKLIDGPRPIAAGSFGDLAHRTQAAKVAVVSNDASATDASSRINSPTGPAFDPIGDVIAKRPLTGKPHGLEMFPHQHAAAEVAERRAERRGPAVEISWAELGNSRPLASGITPIDSAAGRDGNLAAQAYPSAKGTEPEIAWVDQPRRMAQIAEQGAADQLEAAYWRFDTIRAGKRVSERDAFKQAIRELDGARAAFVRPVQLSPELEAAIADGGKVVENRPRPKTPIEVDRNRFLGSVPIAGYGECACRPGDTCPLGKDPAVAGTKCDIDELTAAGHNWHHDKPGTDDGATVGTTAIPSTFDERVPDARVLELWENAHCGHNAIAHPVELQALCEELNQHRRAATGHHNSKHMQSLREQLHASRQLANQSTKDLAAARLELGNLQRSRDSADEQVRIMSEALAASNAENGKLVAKVERLEHEIALVTKHATPIPEMPLDCEERAGALYLCEPGRTPRLIDNPAALYAWAARLMAERNAARETAIALDRRIAAMTRTMTPQPVVSGPQPGPVNGAHIAEAPTVESRWPDNVDPKRFD